MMKHLNITILGGTGFIGSHLVKKLAKMDATLNIVCTNPDAAKYLKLAGSPGQISFMRGNIKDEAFISRAIRGADVVINLVGILYAKGHNRFSVIHSRGAETVAKAAKQSGVEKLIHISALGVDKPSGSRYARSKLNGENAVRAAFPGVTILRPSVVFGVQDSFFNRFARMAKISPFLPLIGGGKTRFQPVFVGDVVDAIIATIIAPEAPGRIYELGGPQVYSFKELMEYMLGQMGKKRILLPIPFPAASLLGYVTELLPHPPLTHDQVKLLKVDNVVSPQAHGLIELGIAPTPLEMIAPKYLRCYR